MRVPTVEGDPCATIRGRDACPKPAVTVGSRRGHDTKKDPPQLADAAFAQLKLDLDARLAWDLLTMVPHLALGLLALCAGWATGVTLLFTALATPFCVLEPLLRRWTGAAHGWPMPRRLGESVIWQGALHAAN